MAKWEMVRLEDVCSVITDGTHQTPTYCMAAEEGYPFLSSKNVITQKIDWGNVKYIPQDLHNKLYERLTPQRNDILLAKNGTTGVAALVDRDCVFDIYVSLALLRPKAIVYPNYLLKAINSPCTKKQFDERLKGIGVPNLHLSDIRKVVIPLPPLDIQKKIAATLDKTSELINLRRQQIEKLDLLVKSRFVEMFGDPVTNPMGWEVKRLEEYTLFLTSGSRGWSGYFSDDGEMFLTIKNVKNRSITTDNMQYVHAPNTKEAERTRVKEGDLLVSITADLGRTGVVNAEIADYGAYINQHLSLVRLDQTRINPNFISHYLETEAGKRQFESKNQVGVKAGLNFNAINSLTVAVPPLELQNNFIAFSEAADKSKFEMQKGLELLQLNYKALMLEYFKQ